MQSNSVRDFERAKDNVLIKREYVNAAVFVSSKFVISHNNTAHPLLGQNKTKQNETKQTKKVKHNISTRSYKKPIFYGLCPWNPHSLIYTLHVEEISVKIINSTQVSKKWAVWRRKLTFYVNRSVDWAREQSPLSALTDVRITQSTINHACKCTTFMTHLNVQ